MKAYPEYKDSGIEWVGDIPSEWKVIRFKYALSLITNKASDNNLMQIALENITSWTGRFVKSGSQFEGDGILFENNDILFGKLRPYLAKVWKANFSGSAVGDIFVFRPQDFIFPNFAFYRMISAQYIHVINGSTFGAKMPRASWNFIGNLPFFIASLPEQKQIAKYLDHKTAKIDSLIEKKKRLIELLKEERTAVINQAVTKGLDPNVPMKDSGIEWLGEIPAHWEIGTLKHFLTVIDCKHITAEFFEEGFPLVSIKEVQSWEVNLTNAKITNEAFYRVLIDGNRKPVPGDIIYSRNATVGEAALVTNKHPDSAMGQDVCLLRPEGKIISKFILFQLKSKIVLNQLELLMVGATFKRINVEDIKNYYITVPPIYEQSEISEYLLSQASKIDSIISKSQKEIELLQEYRTALISEVVTGKIDVREEKI